MGLLDEAIREHLELRRRHGVDPAVVAREELDALAPVEGEEKPGRWSASAEASADEARAGQSPQRGARAVTLFDGDLVAGGATRSGAEPGDASFMEATAEIDMRTVLGELEHAMSGHEAGGEARVRRAVHAENTAPVAAGSGARLAFDVEGDEDPLTWEMSALRMSRLAQNARGGSGDLSPEAPGS